MIWICRVNPSINIIGFFLCSDTILALEFLTWRASQYLPICFVLCFFCSFVFLFFIFFVCVWSVVGPFARISQRYFTGIELTLGISVHSWLEHMRTHKTSTLIQSTNKRSHLISNILTFLMCNQRPIPWNNLIITILVAWYEYIKVTFDNPNNKSLWIND